MNMSVHDQTSKGNKKDDLVIEVLSISVYFKG